MNIPLSGPNNGSCFKALLNRYLSLLVKHNTFQFHTHGISIAKV